MRDRYERKHRRTCKHPDAIAMVANADFSRVPPLAEAMGLESLRCIHGGLFPCQQCVSNRRWNECATKTRLSEVDFELIYAQPVEPHHSLDSAHL